MLGMRFGAQPRHVGVIALLSYSRCDVKRDCCQHANREQAYAQVSDCKSAQDKHAVPVPGLMKHGGQEANCRHHAEAESPPSIYVLASVLRRNQPEVQRDEQHDDRKPCVRLKQLIEYRWPFLIVQQKQRSG